MSINGNIAGDDRIELHGPIGGYFVWNARDEENDDSPLFL
jgi:hypothetical protein